MTDLFFVLQDKQVVLQDKQVVYLFVKLEIISFQMGIHQL